MRFEFNYFNIELHLISLARTRLAFSNETKPIKIMPGEKLNINASRIRTNIEFNYSYVKFFFNVLTGWKFNWIIEARTGIGGGEGGKIWWR